MKTKLLTALLIFSFSSIVFATDCKKTQKGLQEGLRYFHSEQFLLASQLFSQVKVYGEESCKFEYLASYFQTASFLKLQDLNAFELSFQDLNHLALTQQQREQTQLLRAYAYKTSDIQGVNESLKKRWKTWAAKDEISLTDLKPESLQEVFMDYSKARKTKSTWIAGTMSALVPGAGQAYVGAYQSAALAFVFNALLLGATLDFHRKNMGLAAAASGAMFSMTYVGNIASAVKGASSINQKMSAPFEQKLRQGLLPELEF